MHKRIKKIKYKLFERDKELLELLERVKEY